MHIHADTCIYAHADTHIHAHAQAVLNSVTGAENYVAYSPSCLLPREDSAGQARIQLLAGLLTPVAVALLCLAVWALRWGR